MKASLLGLAYGLKKITSNSTTAGMDLKKFSIFTGLSTKKLQQWQWAARQTGIASDVVASSVKSVQSAMSNMLLGKGPPEAMFLLSKYTDFDRSQVRDTFYVMNKLSEFSRKAPKDVGNRLLSSFGLSEDMIVGLRKIHKYKKQIQSAPIYSNSEIDSLKNISVMWSKITYDMDLAIGKFVATLGAGTFEKIGVMMESTLALVISTVEVLEKAKVFELISKIPEGLTHIINGIEGLITFAKKNLSGILGTISGGFGLEKLFDKLDFSKTFKGPDLSEKIKATDSKKLKEDKIQFAQNLKNKTPEEKYKALNLESNSTWNNLKSLSKKIVFTPFELYEKYIGKKSKKIPKVSKETIKTIQKIKENGKQKNNRILKLVPNKIIREPQRARSAGTDAGSGLKVNQVLNFQHPGKNAVAIQSASMQGIQDAYRIKSTGQEN